MPVRWLRMLLALLLAACAWAQNRQEGPSPDKDKQAQKQDSSSEKNETPAVRQSSDRMVPQDFFNIQYAAEPQLSPDGRKIVYERRFADIMSDRSCSNLWVINVDGTENRPLTSGIHSDSSPRWSPDGTRIAYISDGDGDRSQIYVRWMDTGQTARVTDVEFAPSNIVWSPDGRQLAFSSMVPAKPLELAEIPKAPQGAKWQEAPKAYDKLIYRFNGRGYLHPGYSQFFVVSAEGGTPRQVTTGDFPNGGFAFQPTRAEAVWSPDSKFLLVASNRRPDFEYDPLETDIYEFNITDSSVRALTDRKGPDYWPSLSPDGRRIAYVGFDDQLQGYQITHLYLMNRDGSDPRMLTPKLDRDVSRPQWAPDGTGIMFLYDEEGDTKLAIALLDGTVKKLADHVGSGGSSYSSGNSFTVAKDGTFVFPYTDSRDPGDIAVGNLHTGKLKVITNLNRDLFDQRRLGNVEEFWFNSSVDQRKIQGWIIKPPDFKQGKRYPLILEIHGGPFANYGDRFDIEKQIYAARGYVVVYINPRGSTSYGEQFGNLIHHAYPGDDFFDLNSGVDAVLARGYVDPDNLFVTGGSGGGVLTCWMIGRSSRFRAAAALYPVINWYSFVLTADIPSLVTKYWFEGNPWDYTENYMKRSVISLVKNVKTPTMVMTGEGDYRTPISEAEQYYEALKLLRVESVLVRVPDEPHGISRHPSHHMAKVIYVMSWFDRHRSNPERPDLMRASSEGNSR